MKTASALRRLILLAAGTLLLLFAAACTASPGSPDQTEPLPPTPAPQPAQALPPAGGEVRFERVLDEFAETLGGPSQVAQDAYGFIWIGSVDGLARYDGYHYTYYQHDLDDPASLSNNQVTAVLADHAGRLWVGTQGGGLDRFERDSGAFTHFTPDPDDPGSLSDGRVNVLYEDSRGRLWVGTASGGLARLDGSGSSFVHYRYDAEVPLSLPSNTVYAVFEDSRGDLWVGTNQGLARMQAESGLFTRFQHDPDLPNSLSHDSVYAIAEDADGSLWLGTYGGGLSRLDPQDGSFTSFRYDARDPTSLSSDIVTSLAVDRSGMLWVGTMGGGVNRLDTGGDDFDRYLYNPDDPHSPSSSYINRLFIDRAGILWTSTARLLDKYDPYKEKFAHQFRRDHVTAIYEDRDGFLWVGAFDGLYQYDQRIDQVTHFRHESGDPGSLSEWRVTAIVQDRLGSLWVGTSGGGLDRLEGANQRFLVYRHDPLDAQSLPSDVVSVLYVDRAGTLWVGTDGGLARYDRQGGRFLELPLAAETGESRGDLIVRALLEDRQGRLWIGTEGGGLKRYDPASGVLTTYRHNKNDPGSLRNNVIYALFEDSNGLLWAGTEGGLHRFDPQTGSFTYYGLEHGLPDDEVFAILEDLNGNLWMSTDRGLSKFNPGTQIFRNYDAEDGLQDNQFSGAALRRRTGEMLFGGVNGISAFSPDQISDNPYVPPVVLLALRQDGRPIPLEGAVESLGELTLPGLAGDLEFEFAALSYSQPERNQHAYMLEGYDSDWHYLGSGRNGRYDDLPGGTYTLRLSGANDDGVWNESGAALRLTVQPPFWETGWFWGLVVALVVGAAVGGYRIRLASVEARNRELEQQVLERTRESERRRKELEALYQLAAIKERTRLARDLHDSVKQKTFAALAQIGASRRMIPGQPERAAGYIEEAETLVHDVLQELVTMIQEMYPNNLPERGLADALRDYAVQWTRQSGILVELRTDGEGRLAPELEAALYRVFQEALSNVARHSQADHVTVELRCYEQTLDAAYLKICDNGSGFDPGKVQAGVGLRSMRERVEALGGLLYLTSAPGEGTCLEVILPGTSEVEPDKQLVSNQAVEMT